MLNGLPEKAMLDVEDVAEHGGVEAVDLDEEDAAVDLDAEASVNSTGNLETIKRKFKNFNQIFLGKKLPPFQK